MKKELIKIYLISIITFCFFMIVTVSVTNAQWNNWNNLDNWGNRNDWSQNNYGWMDDYDSDFTRSSAWHETQYGTTSSGGTWMFGQFGPDVGIGEQGSRYEYSDPLRGTYISYSATGMGMGMGGPLMGYGGMYSPVAALSYGPYAWGQSPNIPQTPFYDTQGYLSGNLWGQGINAYASQYNPIGGLMGMIGGGFRSYPGFGNFAGNYSGLGGSFFNVIP